jgi:hypothetical protein
LLNWQQQQHAPAASVAAPGIVGDQWAGAQGAAGAQQQGTSSAADWMEPEYMI